MSSKIETQMFHHMWSELYLYMEKQDKVLQKSGQKTCNSLKNKMTWTCPDYLTRSTVIKNRLKAALFLPCFSWEAEEEVFTNHLKPPLSWKWEPILPASAFASFRATVAAAVCRRTVWWISKPKASVCILIIAGSLVSPLKQPEYSEWTTFFFFNMWHGLPLRPLC